MQDIKCKGVTIDEYSSLFTTIRYCLLLFALFETICLIQDYLLFTIGHYSLFGFSRHLSSACI